MKSDWADGVWTAIPDAFKKAHAIRDRLHQEAKRLNGIVSGEHGIGIVKKPYMSMFLDTAQIELMRGIKNLFDPNGILNPGKVLPG
jgi:FAD/FMN-containing dehydrogenase